MHSTRITSWIVSIAIVGTSVATSAEDTTPSAPSNVPTQSAAPMDQTSVGSTTGTPGAESTAPSISLTPEPTFRSETQRRIWPNGPLLATGATIFTAAYVPAVIGAAVSDRGDDDLYIPVAGPWMTLKNGPDETRTEKTLLILDGVAQGLGALMLVSGLFVPTKKTKDWYLIGMAPGRVGTGYGMGAAGRF